ncbi:MAG TPA: outer membrane beta-barrel protein [Gemmatimonadaceae bacterium]|jgi:hypothetical protein
MSAAMHTQRVALTVLILAANAAPMSRAQAQTSDTATTRTFGGFVDTYYAWDTDRPRNFDRSYTTQPARYAEANINLAFIEAKVAGPRYRGRLALQWGTSVQSNYAAEPRNGVVSGPSVSQYIQEATAGYQVAPSLWLDGGIFLSHVGYEGWISRDNVSYTRSLVADFSPYYESGAKLTWTTSPKLTTTVVLINGWQNISAENSTPATGVRLDYTPVPALTVTYDDFIGDVAPDSEPTRLRIYHDVLAQYTGSARWLFAAMYSLGTQGNTTPAGGIASWWGMTTFAKYHATPTVALVARVERYSDPSQVIVATGTPSSFQTNAASLGVDVALRAPLLWRTEVRAFRSNNRIWPLHGVGALGENDGVVVTSLALTF